jgi:addiction module HigA family antidote
VRRFVSIEAVARRKLVQLHAAATLDFLRVPPGNRSKRSRATVPASTASASTTSSACVFIGRTATRSMSKLSIVTEEPNMAPKLPPIHPGEILREEFMAPFGLSSTALANAIGVTPARVNEIVRERRGISADTALRLARYFGTDAQSWMNLQKNYELETARRELGRSLERIQPRAA